MPVTPLLLINGKRLPLTVYEKHASAPIDCPACGKTLRVRGLGKSPSADDRAWEADAVCVDCEAPCGVIRVEMETMFGIREDIAVGLRARVYSS